MIGFDAVGVHSVGGPQAAELPPDENGPSPIDVSKISPSRIVAFESSGSRVTPFEGSGSRIVRFE